MAINPIYIKAFVSSIQNVFATMLKLPVQVKEPALKSAPNVAYEVSGIIGMSGDVTGSVVLSFPKATAQRVVSILAGQNVDPASPDFADAVGELVNMVSGGAKAMFTGKKVSISCPSVVLGQHVVAKPSSVPTIVIPCGTDCGELAIEITIQDAAAAAKPGEAA